MQLIVLGMHRSGTSVLSRMLNLMGAYFGPEGSSTGANTENPKGFWERRDIRALNDLVLLGSGCDWNRLADFDVSKVPADVRTEFDTRARRLLLEIDGHRPWFIKEPRLCVLMPLWRPLLEVPVALHILRNPVEVAASLQTRNKIPMKAGLALWERYLRSAVEGADGLPVVVISHRRLMMDPVAELEALYGALMDIGVVGLRRPSTNELAKFVDPSLYREREDRKELRSLAGAPQVALYNKIITRGLSKAVLGTEGKSVKTALLDYEKTLPPLPPSAEKKPAATPASSPAAAAASAAPPSGGVDAATLALREKMVAREQEAKTLRETAAKLQADIHAREAVLAQELVALGQLQADAAGRDEIARVAHERVGRLEEQLAMQAARVLEMEKELAAAREAERHVVAERGQRETRIAELDAELADAMDLRHKAEFLATRHELELARLKDLLADQDVELAKTRGDADDARIQALAAAQELAGMESRLGVAMKTFAAQLAEIVAERSTALDRIRELEVEVSRGETALAGVRGELDSARIRADQGDEAAASLASLLASAQVELRCAGDQVAEQRQRAEKSEAEIGVLRAHAKKAEDTAGALKKQLAFEADYCHDLSRSLEQRFAELAVLTKLLSERGRELDTARLATEVATVKNYALEARLRSAKEDLRAIERSRWYRHMSRFRRLLGHGPAIAAHDDQQAQLEAIRSSELFDAEWYLRQYPDVAADGADPALHYLQFGGLELRRPGPEFDAREYFRRNPDVMQAGMNPLLHYVLHGRAEGRS
jgi:hypothetical protein